MNLRVLSIFGTRPEAVKMAPVVRELTKRPEITSLVCVTAQHRQMLDQVLDLFEISPDVDLNLMQPDQELASLTADIFTHLDPVLVKLKPDWILVQGDTTTVMAASLSAFYRHIRIGHVEAGLRTHDKWQPFPEEINRRLASVVTDLHFAPTGWARQNLLHESLLASDEVPSRDDAARFCDALRRTRIERELSALNPVIDAAGREQDWTRLAALNADKVLLMKELARIRENLEIANKSSTK